MNLAQLSARARELRRQPLTAQTRTALEGLRREADPGVRAAFDAQLKALFADVYGGHTPPPVALTSMGDAARSAGAGGTRGGAVLAFHGARDPAALADAVARRIPEMRTTTPPPMPLEAQFKPLTGAEKQEARAALAAELEGVRVFVDGKATTLLDKLKASGLPVERLVDVLAQVKTGYARVADATGNKPPGYQDVNWKHTRLELDRVLDVVKRNGLSPAQAETALYASFLSDAVKTPQNFLVHNVHGAQAAVHVLSRLVPPPSTEMIEDVARATLEHQIGPPSFMANVALSGALKGAGVDGKLVGSIAAKVAHPFEPAHLTADRAQIAFSDDEKAALAKVGVLAWTVPHEDSRHYAASRAVIDGDSLVNYACPDGWAKLAALHGPDQPPFLQEPRFVDGLLSTQPAHASALKSFNDARDVVSEGSRAAYEGGRMRTERAIGRVLDELTRWVELQPKKDVPRTKDGKVPYLDGALDYGDALQVAFARRLRERGVQLLREQEGIP